MTDATDYVPPCFYTTQHPGIEHYCCLPEGHVGPHIALNVWRHHNKTGSSHCDFCDYRNGALQIRRTHSLPHKVVEKANTCPECWLGGLYRYWDIYVDFYNKRDVTFPFDNGYTYNHNRNWFRKE